MQSPRRRVPRALREQQMLDAATDVFFEQGFQAAAMDEIAARIGLTKPMLYAYFGSKQGLYRATVQRAGQRISNLLQALLDEPDARRRLTLGTDALLDYVQEQRAAWALVFRGRPGPERAVDVTPYREAMSDAITRTLAEAGSGLRHPPAETLHAARPFANGLLGCGEGVLRGWSRETSSREAFADIRRIIHSLVMAHLATFSRHLGRTSADRRP